MKKFIAASMGALLFTSLGVSASFAAEIPQSDPEVSQSASPAPRAERSAAVTTATLVGTATVGSTLSVQIADLPSEATVSYQWFADETSVAGQDDSSLLLTDAYLGKRISAFVVVTIDLGTQIQLTTAASAPVAGKSLAASTPTIAGTAVFGRLLTASAGSWTAGTTLSFQWYANGSAISGANKATFSVTAAQIGKTLTIKVTGKKAGYTTAEKTSKSTATVKAATLTSKVPTISGTSRVGTTLTAKTGSWTSGTSATFQWYANGKVIKGATKKTYVPSASMKGKKITVKVTGKKSGYTTVVKTSKSTATVKAGVLTAKTPTISGTVRVGSKLTAKTGAWTSGTKASFQWYSNGKAIKGATGKTFTLKAAQQGTRITVKVTGKKSGYTTTSRTSKSTSKVAKKPTPTREQLNAVYDAKEYLAYSAFSRKGLIYQLEYEGYSTKDATFAVDYLKVNWNKQAARMAQEYLDYVGGFSRSELIDQLEFEGFTSAQADYGVAAVGY